MTLGESLKVIRARVGLRQGELANRVGISQSLLSLIENDRREPAVDLINRLCSVMGVPPQLVFLMTSTPTEGNERFKPLLDKLSLLMLDILQEVREVEK
jgi:transcriptional regulator with XRE-family HTH domain